MVDLDFYFDPACPWAWITSRWVVEVQRQRSYNVAWKFISLKMINEGTDYSKSSPSHLAAHKYGLQGLRVASAARETHGNDAVGSVYTALGTAFHKHGRRDSAIAETQSFFVDVLSEAGLPVEWASASSEESRDELIRHETGAARANTGNDVGTPILTFNPQTEKAASLFGPVISKIPRGQDATRLWDAVQTIAESGVAEIKRSLRATPQFD